jgi:penicillin-binding protein 1A
MVGGRNYQESEFNRAVQAMRQPGSAFKLFVYYAALRKGMSPRDRIDDAPLEIDGWSPENFDGRFRGSVSLAEAFARSLNAATARLALEVGLDEVITAARDLGLEAPLQQTPSVALGSSEVSLLDLTGAYASVRAGVTPIEPWGIAAFGTGEQSQFFKLGPLVKPQRSLKRYHESLVGLLNLVVERGTGRGLRGSLQARPAPVKITKMPGLLAFPNSWSSACGSATTMVPPWIRSPGARCLPVSGEIS